MTGRVALVSANFGSVDPLLSLPPLPEGVQALYFTDGAGVPPGWSDVGARAYTFREEARYRAKFYKCQIHRLDLTQGFDWFVWADSCLRFSDLSFIPKIIHELTFNGALGAFVPHPDRRTVAEEYEYVLRQIANGNPYLSRRYSAEDLKRERAHFAGEYDLGKLQLWCGGIWILANRPSVCAFLDDWWNCVNTFSIFDQAAMTPLLVRHAVDVVRFDVPLYKNQYWERVPHE